MAQHWLNTGAALHNTALKHQLFLSSSKNKHLMFNALVVQWLIHSIHSLIQLYSKSISDASVRLFCSKTFNIIIPTDNCLSIGTNIVCYGRCSDAIAGTCGRVAISISIFISISICSYDPNVKATNKERPSFASELVMRKVSHSLIVGRKP